MNDTIVNVDKNGVTVVYNSNKLVTLDDLLIEQTPIEHYNIFQISGWKNCKKQHRIKEIISILESSHCTPAETEIVEQLVKEFNDVFYWKVMVCHLRKAVNIEFSPHRE